MFSCRLMEMLLRRKRPYLPLQIMMSPCFVVVRSVEDKRIWASPPIPWNGTTLPPRAAWLHFMAVGQQCCDARVKRHLLRNRVPCSPSPGYSLLLHGAPTLQLNAAWQTGCQTKATREQPPQAAKRQKGLAIAPQADCGSGLQLHTGDGAMVTSKDHTSASDTLAAWTSHLSPQPEDVAVAQLPWLPAQNIHLTMECIASTSSVRVMKVTFYSNALLCCHVLVTMWLVSHATA